LPKAESPDTAGITSKMELTRILSEKSAKAGRQSTLREIERDYERLCRDREIIASISAMREAGARVQYVGLDLSTEQGVGELIKTAMREYGGIDGIIHGAGIIEDCLIKDKTPESFSRVMDTKANSAFLIYRAMEKLSLKFAVFFSSVARFGSVGQADYAAANEILDLIAAPLPGKPDCRVASISWGPWLSRGMTEKLDPSIFQSKGCEPVSIVQGRAWLIDELIKGKLSDSSIILGNGPWSLEEEPPLSRLA
jgi:NAD(P)-dependent dehydrogenase (short-subunit alcohol dehydrogenase family)